MDFKTARCIRMERSALRRRRSRRPSTTDSDQTGACGCTTRRCRWSTSYSGGLLSTSRGGSGCSSEPPAPRRLVGPTLPRGRLGWRARSARSCRRGVRRHRQARIRGAPLSPWGPLHGGRPHVRGARRTNAVAPALWPATPSARGDAPAARPRSRAASCPPGGRVRQPAVQRGTRPMGPTEIDMLKLDEAFPTPI
jgi:hypothetical protein